MPPEAVLEPRVDRPDKRAGGSAEVRDPLDKDRARETGARVVRNSVDTHHRVCAPLRDAAIELAAIGLAYFVFAKVGLALASINPSATPIWPPTGLALAAVILWGYRVWPAIFLAALIANVTTLGSIYVSLAIALGNTFEWVWSAVIWSTAGPKGAHLRDPAAANSASRYSA